MNNFTVGNIKMRVKNKTPSKIIKTRERERQRQIYVYIKQCQICCVDIKLELEFHIKKC